VLVNCIAAELTLPYVEAIAGTGVPFGAYANAATWGGVPCGARPYAELAGQWRAAGATIFGGCCGTTVEYLAALS
jgi:S-methylmethionine-dependent homocysteine/selenocysteine methylase